MPLYKFDIDHKTYKCHGDRPMDTLRKVVTQIQGHPSRFYICKKEIYNDSGKNIAKRYIFITTKEDNLKQWISAQFKQIKIDTTKNNWSQWGPKTEHMTEKDILETVLETYEESGTRIVSKDFFYDKTVYDITVKAFMSN